MQRQKLVNARRPAAALRDPARRSELRAHHPAVREEPRAARGHGARAHRRHRRSTRTGIDNFDFDMTVARLRPVALAGQRAARLLGSAPPTRRAAATWPGSSDPVIDELIDQVIAAPDRASAGRAHARARPRAAVGALRHPAFSHHRVPRRLLGQVRPAGRRAEVRPRLRYLVGRSGKAAAMPGRASSVAARYAPMLAYLVPPAAAHRADAVRDHARSTSSSCRPRPAAPSS